MGLGLDSNRKKSEQDSDNIAELEFDDMDDVKAKGNKVNPQFIIIGAIVVVVVAAAFILLRKVSTNPEQPGQSTGTESAQRQHQSEKAQQGVGDSTEESETEAETRFSPGIVDYEDGEMKTPERLDSAADFLRNLNGVDIPVSYNVKSMDYVCDYANYEKRRASMDDGMELYWLEITYNGLHYRCTVPFWRYKAMNDEGICIVKIEVLSLEGGEKVISYMAVTDSIED